VSLRLLNSRVYNVQTTSSSSSLKNAVFSFWLMRDCFCCHLQDVQPAEEPDWKTDPFECNATNEYFYGRGCSDNKVLELGMCTYKASISQRLHVEMRERMLVLTRCTHMQTH
jgi:hypothetical protein